MTILSHLAGCTACAGHWRALEELESIVRVVPQVGQDPALVARIQASIAAQPVQRVPAWSYVFGGIAAAALLVFTGWLLDTRQWVPLPAWPDWRTGNEVLPDWPMLKTDLAGLPQAVSADLDAAFQSAGQWWDREAAWTLEALGVNSMFLWAGFLACFAGAALVNGAEILSHRTPRPRS